jgi:hypothetical protein
MTPLDWDEHPDAREEYLEAIQHYLTVGGQKTAERLQAQRQAALDLITSWPEALPPYLELAAKPTIRHCGIGKFPYRVIYQPRENGIWVLAYAHEKRKPGYWSSRLGQESQRPDYSV